MAKKTDPLPGQMTLGQDIMGYEVYRPSPKIVAFGDVHLGNYRYPIRADIIDAMAQIETFIHRQKPDVVLFAGDAFRHRVPSAADVAAFGSFIKGLAEVALVYMIPGNHDLAGNATTIDVYQHFANVNVVHYPTVVPLGSYQIACVPWLPQKALISTTEEGRDTAGAIRAMLDLLKRQLDPNCFSVLLAHATILGGAYHEGASTILGNDVLWTSDMFDGFDLTILGHIHNPQAVDEKVFYVGSPCPVSFNESDQAKAVFMWDGAPIWEPLQGPRFIQAKASEMEQYEFEGKDFVQIIKEHDEPEPEELPGCAWYEIITRPPKRDMRQRLGDTVNMGPGEAMAEWLTMEGHEPGPVLDLAEELMGVE